jgi:two-component system cell cycle response regulator
MDSSVRMPAAVKVCFAVLGAWLALYELHLLVPVPFADALFGRYVHDALLLVATGLCALRAFRFPAERLAWGLMAGALLSWSLGEIYYTAVLWTAKTIPVPSPADIGYLGVYPLAFSGLIVLLRTRAKHVSATLWVDGVIAALVVAALGAAVVFQEVLATVGGRPVSIATNLAYPLGDLLLLGIVATAYTLRRWKPDRGGLLLGLGIAVFWTADSLYLVETAQNTYTQGGFFDVGWWAGISLIALAAWQPAQPMPTREKRESLRTIAAPIGFALLGLGLLVYGTLYRVNLLAVAFATVALLAVIVRLVMTFRERIQTLELTKGEALTDALTGLGNRRHLMLELDRRFSPGAIPRSFYVVLFDLDGFKLYNDRFGHPAGDALLVRLGGHFRTAVEPYGNAYRIGGDEFCALVDSAESKFESVVRAACTALSEDGDGFEVGTSYGAVYVPTEARSASEALGVADVRLYENKQQRRAAPQDHTRVTLLQMLRELHPHLHEHLSEVADLARAVARHMRLSEEQIDEVVRAAELHDVGKMAIPDTILDKPGPLNDQEREFMERHTLLGERILRTTPALASIAGLVRSSHERYDGAGYPDGLAAERIPLGARIVFACDAFSAMTSDRPYARRKSASEALEEMQRCAGTQFDPRVVAALRASLSEPTARDELTSATHSGAIRAGLPVPDRSRPLVSTRARAGAG